MTEQSWETEFRLYYEAAMERYPEKVHYSMDGPGDVQTACVVAGENTKASVWGEFSVTDKTKVGCPICLEWLHA